MADLDDELSKHMPRGRHAGEFSEEQIKAYQNLDYQIQNTLIALDETFTALDFEIGRVHQYKISAWGDNKEWNPDSESIEDFLSSVGHNLANCEWMVHENGQVITRDAEWTRFTN